jgi:hypothetical protein
MGVCGQPASRPTFGSSKVLLVATSAGDTYGAVFANGGWSGQKDFDTSVLSGYGSISVTPDGAGGAVAAMTSGNEPNIFYAQYSSSGQWVAFQPLLDGQGNQILGDYPTLGSFGSTVGMIWATEDDMGDEEPPGYATLSGSTWAAGPSLTQEVTNDAAVVLTSYGATAVYTDAQQGLVVQDLCGTSWSNPFVIPGGLSNEVTSVQIVNLSGNGADMLVVLEDGSGVVYYTTRTGTSWAPVQTVDSTYQSEGPPHDMLALAALPNGRAVMSFTGLPSAGGTSSQSVYAYVWDNGAWGPAAVIADGTSMTSVWYNAIGGQQNGVAPGVGGDGAELVFTAEVGNDNVEAYHSRLQGTTWSTPQRIAPPSGSAQDYYQVALTTL